MTGVQEGWFAVIFFASVLLILHVAFWEKDDE